MKHVRSILLASAAGLVMVSGAQAADQLLSGAITSASGQKLDGVTVSAKLDGSTITTSVYSDENGNYYFPALPAGKYSVWANALGFETAKSTVDLSAKKQQSLSLKPIADQEAMTRQLPSELLVAALPEATPEDAAIKKIFTNNCTGCHSPGYALQFKFDEAGWNKIINLMKVVPGSGVYPGPGAKASQIIEHNQKALAAYLARARGPGETSMKFTARQRPTGESARAVWTLYDLPLNPDAGIGTQVKYNPNDGTDWNLGTTSKLGQMPHDGNSDTEGNLYFTLNNPNKQATIGKVDGKTGEVKYFKVNRADGLAANAHGITRDADGNFWFDVNPGRRSLGKFDIKAEKITVYQTPQNMSPLGGAVTMDIDGKGFVWASAPDGAVRFDPKTEKFVDFKSKTPYQNPKGSGMTYGAAGDRDGVGWWAQMAMDTIGRGDPATGQITEVKLPAVKNYMDIQKPEDKAFYENFNELGFNSPVPWSQGPRRMGTDKNADVLWVGNSWGASLAKINTKTLETTIVPFPDKTMQPYHIAVDNNHNVWGNLWTSDQIVKFDPAANKWSTFELPVRGTEIRHISLLERDGKTYVTVPVYRSSQMGAMYVRSDAELAALKAQAQ
jgi:streptogramin lyase/mono/diheme cytochrome c family protein